MRAAICKGPASAQTALHSISLHILPALGRDNNPPPGLSSEPLPCYNPLSMKIAVISDIHANLEAFTSVLEDMEDYAPDAVYCCGDSIGYGPDPEAVIQLVRARGIPQVYGNHELGCMERKELAWFNPMARKAILRTKDMLSERSLAWLRTLPASIAPWEPGLDSCYFVHGCPPDSARTYLFEIRDDQLPAIFEHTGERVSFVGHTHELCLVSYDGHKATRNDLLQGTVRLRPDRRYLVNVGSVGQPRDSTNHAKYVLWDPIARLLTVRYVLYDIATTAEKILAAGLPEQYARRLW